MSASPSGRYETTARLFALLVLCGAVATSVMPLQARAGTSEQAAEHDLGEVGNKLANPLTSLWALSSSFNAPQFFDGNVNSGDPEVGGVMVFQPIMPIPLYGHGDETWRMITRPIIPLVFSAPDPKGPDQFDHDGGIGDIQLPLLLALPDRFAGQFILGAGPVFLFPSATSDALGQNQWATGPAVVVGYKTENATFGAFPNYFWKIGSADQGANTPDLEQMSLLYFANYRLPEAWQIGFNPTISYNDKASSGNKWNVPVGMYVGRTIQLGRLPVNIKVGSEYSVVSQDAFGQRFQFRFQITPVIPSLISSPIFGG